jgi:hypothetical protein
MTTVDRIANQPAQRSAKRARTTQSRRPQVKAGDDRVVIIDIDGVLADLNAYESLLAVDERPAEQRWEEFFAHIPDAAVIDTGYDLAWAIDGLGYTIVYSTTRPRYTRDASGLWLTDKDFPTGKALFTRPKTPAGLHPQPAWQTKLSHARAVTNTASGYARSSTTTRPCSPNSPPPRYPPSTCTPSRV